MSTRFDLESRVRRYPLRIRTCDRPQYERASKANEICCEDIASSALFTGLCSFRVIPNVGLDEREVVATSQ